MNEKLSQGNGFTLGYQGRPHGFSPGAPAKPSKLPPQFKRGGFGHDNGTIPGLDSPVPHVFNGAKKK